MYFVRSLYRKNDILTPSTDDVYSKLKISSLKLKFFAQAELTVVYNKKHGQSYQLSPWNKVFKNYTKHKHL